MWIIVSDPPSRVDTMDLSVVLRELIISNWTRSGVRSDGLWTGGWAVTLPPGP